LDIVPTTLKICIGICTYNEENNITNLLENLFTKQNLPNDCMIVIVDSGSTDATRYIVQKYMKRYKNLILLAQEKRQGKASALRLLFKYIENKADVCVLVNADALPDDNTILKLIYPLERERNIGAVASRPVPLSNPTRTADALANLVWNLHHRISLSLPKLSGELCAIRTALLPAIPKKLATDEPYLEMVINKLAYKILYRPDIIVRIRTPSNLAEYLKHRTRIWTGHLQLRNIWGYKVSTMTFTKVVYALGCELIAQPKQILAALLGVFCEIIAYLIARHALSKGEIPYIWEPLKTTKSRQTNR